VTEADIRRQIVEFLQRHSDRCLFTVNAKPRGKFVSKSWPPKGWSDLSGAWDGRALFIEVKNTRRQGVPGNKIIFRDKARALGCIAFFASSVEDVKRELGI
jgi:hypothetical protein